MLINILIKTILDFVQKFLYKKSMQKNHKKTFSIAQNASEHVYDICILGAGAAGLMCALTAAKRGHRVALIDHNKKAGKKIQISGGGKANFTNLHMGSAFYVGEEPSFAEPALEAFTPRHMQDFMLKHGLAYEEREHGQLFGLEPATTLIDALTKECTRNNCHFYLEHTIEKLEYADQHFVLNSQNMTENNGSLRTFSAKNIVLALGSPAYAHIGASAKGVELAAQFGHTHAPFKPVLTSLIMPKDWALTGLSGISLPVNITCNNYSRRDPLLFTHKGISGPVVLQTSCHWQPHTEINIDFLPHISLKEILDAPECGKLYVRTLITRHMPQRLADKLIPEEWGKRKIAELSRATRNALHQCVHMHKVTPLHTGGMEKAEAARGGIHTCGVHPWSMESLKQKNLYIIGELLDITGQLGGYNLHFAFASGHLAGLSIE